MPSRSAQNGARATQLAAAVANVNEALDGRRDVFGYDESAPLDDPLSFPVRLDRAIRAAMQSMGATPPRRGWGFAWLDDRGPKSAGSSADRLRRIQLMGRLVAAGDWYVDEFQVPFDRSNQGIVQAIDVAVRGEAWVPELSFTASHRSGNDRPSVEMVWPSEPSEELRNDVTALITAVGVQLDQLYPRTISVPTSTGH